MKLDLRPKLQQDLEASCKYPSVSCLEIRNELNSSELIRDLLQANNKHSQDNASALSAYAEWHITNSLPGHV